MWRGSRRARRVLPVCSGRWRRAVVWSSVKFIDGAPGPPDFSPLVRTFTGMSAAPWPEAVRTKPLHVHQHAVYVLGHLPVRVGGTGPGRLPHILADFGPGPADRRQCAGTGRSRGVHQARDGGIGGHRSEPRARPEAPPYRTGSPRPAPPPVRGPATILPGSCTARGLRHGINAADIAASRPVLRTVSTSSAPPACETTVPTSSRTRARGYDPIRLLTRGVLLSLRLTGPSARRIVAPMRAGSVRRG